MLLPEQLAKAGLHGKVARFYLAALELGEAPVYEIAKRAGIGRTTAYDVLARLIDEGLIAQVEKSGRTYVLPENPDTLLRKQEDRRQNLTELLPELRSIYSHSAKRPHVRFYEGKEGIRTVLYDTMQCRSKRLDAILSTVELLRVPGEKEMERYIRKRIEAGISLRVVRSRIEEVGYIWASSVLEKRELRYAPSNQAFTMTMYIYDEKVAVISSLRENFGMIIESPEYVRLQETLFETLWQASTPAP